MRDRKEEETVVIATVENSIEAAIAEDALKDAGIPVMVRTFQDAAYDGLFVFQKGYGRVMVPAKYFDQATEIVRVALESERDEEDNDSADP